MTLPPVLKTVGILSRIEKAASAVTRQTPVDGGGFLATGANQ
jgi:hypothetical protein